MLQHKHSSFFSWVATCVTLSSSLGTATATQDSLSHPLVWQGNPTCTEDLLIRQIVDNTEDYAEQQFNIFKSKYKKNYTTKEEHDYQFGVFKANLESIEERNKINKVALKNYKLGCVSLSNRVEPDTEESLLFVIVFCFLVVLLVWCMLKRAFGYSLKDAAVVCKLILSLLVFGP
ncbi:cathepsin F [Trifolium repens]|nr:cathepsin F [Trifolium repens]